MAFFLRYSQQSLVNLITSKLRSSLAILGILVGTAAMVALINGSQLATEKALAQFKALDTNLVAVSVFQQAHTSKQNTTDAIALQTWRSLPRLIPEALHIAPYTTLSQPVSFQGTPVNATIIGADETLASTVRIRLKKGRFVSHLDSFSRICVIGHALERQLRAINVDNPLGKQLHIGDTLYTIVGVARPWRENGFFNTDVNQSIIIPISGIALISQQTTLNSAIFLLRDGADIGTVISKIKQVVHGQAPHVTVFVRSAKQIVESMEAQRNIFTLLLAVIGSISLWVGGIGVMNVMLISVAERRKEIGIRKALGARNYEIQILFLVESIILSLLGGVLGVIIGLLITCVIAYVNQWPFAIYPTPVIVGFSVSVVTGIFFGFYPARKAAQLEPIQALRGI